MVSDKQRRQQLRQTLLQRRNALTEAEQTDAGAALSQQIRTGFQNCSLPVPKIAAGYFPARGEIDTLPALNWLRSQGCITCLPVMSAHTSNTPDDSENDKLRFAAFDHNTAMKTGRYNIPIPDVTEQDLFDSRQLDLVLVPLTGFDEQGNRLGMGGGFYDRTFSWRRSWRRAWRRRRCRHEQPQQLFIGVAHECQKLPQVPVQSWDIVLDAVVTDQHWYRSENSEFAT